MSCVEALCRFVGGISRNAGLLCAAFASPSQEMLHEQAADACPPEFWRNPHAFQIRDTAGECAARPVQPADQVPDDFAAIAGQCEKAGTVVNQDRVIPRALAGGPLDIPEGIVAAAIFTEQLSN